MEEKCDVIIIGSGPAGLSASIYASRAQLKSVVIEENYMSGGQVLTTGEVDNYPGIPGINGFDLSNEFRKHADKLGGMFVTEHVENISVNRNEEGRTVDIEVKTDKNQYRTQSIIIATGTKRRLLQAEGEEQFKGKGVSYCATCDGAFFKGKSVAVVGGGDTAVGEAIYLSNICRHVYLIHRREEFRAAKSFLESLEAHKNIEVLYDTKVISISGEGSVTGLTVQSISGGENKILEVQGVFIAVGSEPENKVVPEDVNLDENGYIIADESGKTNVEGIFAAGDVRTKSLRQIVTAVSDGACCVDSVTKYVGEKVERK